MPENADANLTSRERFLAIVREAQKICARARGIVIYGSGDVLPKILGFLDQVGASGKLLGIFDDNPSKWGLRYGGLKVSAATAEGVGRADLVIPTFPTYGPKLERLDPTGRADILEGFILDYALSVLNRDLNTLTWLITSACNSRCTICGYWRSPPVHLGAEIIVRTINEYPQTNHYLSGGECFCHPEWRRILGGIRRTEHILLLTNGLLPERTWEAADAFGIRKFSISLDGGPETYERVRGLDGYRRVLRTIRGLRDRPGTAVTVSLVIAPPTTVADFQHVEALCREWGLYLSVIIYREWPQFTDIPRLDEAVAHFADFLDPINRSPVVSDLDRRFYNTYLAWHAGRLRMPCTSGFTKVYIDEQGDVRWCADRLGPEDRLGNVNELPLGEILRSSRFDRIADRLHDCNGCWNRSFRRFDMSCHWASLMAQMAEADQGKPTPLPATTST